MEIWLSKDFKTQYKTASNKIQSAFDKRFELFQQDPKHPLLHNHSLSGRLKGFRSINITGDCRALYIEQRNNQTIIIVFKALGTHSQLYK